MTSCCADSMTKKKESMTVEATGLLKGFRC